MSLYEELLEYWDESEERCGVVLAGDRVVWVRNSAGRFPLPSLGQHAHFLITLEDLDDALGEDRATLDDVVGVWHTHPSRSMRPSEWDVAGWPVKESGQQYDYYIVGKLEVTRWRLDDHGDPVLYESVWPTLSDEVSGASG